VNEETLVGLMIEDKEGVDNIEEILSVEGIDFIYIGKMDMAFSYGVSFTPQTGRDDPVVEEAVAKICVECKKRGIPVRFSVGVAPEDIVENVKRWLSKGRPVTDSFISSQVQWFICSFFPLFSGDIL